MILRTYYPYKSDKPDKKYYVVTKTGSRVYFGSAVNKDYTIYYKEQGKDVAEIKRKAYIARHSKLNEDWTKSGINGASFWSRWFLWEKPTKKEALQYIKSRFF